VKWNLCNLCDGIFEHLNNILIQLANKFIKYTFLNNINSNINLRTDQQQNILIFLVFLRNGDNFNKINFGLSKIIKHL
jgi:hypothetical protein